MLQASTSLCNTLISLLKKHHSVEQCKQIQSIIVTCGLYSIQDTFFLTKFIQCVPFSQNQNTSLCLFFNTIHTPNTPLFNKIIAATSHPRIALLCYARMRQMGVQQDNYTFPSLLKILAKSTVVDTFMLYAQIYKLGFHLDRFVSNALISAFANSGFMESARQVFDESPFKDTVAWNALIYGYVKNDCPGEALKCFVKMRSTDMRIDEVTVSSILRAAALVGDAYFGKWVHGFYVEAGRVRLDGYVYNVLVHMYFKCGHCDDASKAFNEMPYRDVVSWNILVSGYVQCNRFQDALRVFWDMLLDNMVPDEFTLTSVLNACAHIGDLDQGKLVHQYIVHNNINLNALLGNALVWMYFKCGHCEDACKVFNEMPCRDVVSWTMLVSGFVQCNKFQDALRVFQDMLLDNIVPNELTLIGVLGACAHIGALDQGRLIHGYIVCNNVNLNALLGNALVWMYAKCGRCEDACKVFNEMPYRDVVSWTALVSGYEQCNKFQDALCVFRDMLLDNIVPNEFTLTSVLSACAHIGALDQGRLIHRYIVCNNINLNTVLGNALMWMYFKCGHCDDACKVFNEMPYRDVVSWTMLVSGYVQCNKFQDALCVFSDMLLDNIVPDEFTLRSVLSACARIGALDQGRLVHQYIIRNNINLNAVLGNALVWMYFKCDHCENACKVFSEMPYRDVVCWNMLVCGFVQCNKFQDALRVFWDMLLGNIVPDEFTLTSVLSACARIGTLDQGRLVHQYIECNNINLNAVIGTALVDMYAKCGCIDEALRVFEILPIKDVYTWTTIINGLAMHGDAIGALNLFYCMLKNGMQPDEVTFTGALSACSHAGFVDEGKRLFELMSRAYHLKPNMDHYGCMVDLLGRAGYLEDAKQIIENMPMKPSPGVLGALLGACMVHADFVMGELIGHLILDLQPDHSGSYAPLANLYAMCENWEAAAQVKKLMKGSQVEKTPGHSWIEVDGFNS
ncbi:hypothetical protein VNO77_35959 [Canavalia gladiata]|uniref:Pentatricopeptide repeat-containing protein n=1 Tax=Canavalia gladiata TaxID=3824 RepID=A0AAN9K6M3_CANGL